MTTAISDIEITLGDLKNAFTPVYDGLIVETGFDPEAPWNYDLAGTPAAVRRAKRTAPKQRKSNGN